MTKILITSDSHGLTSELEQLKRRHEDDVAVMIHCGDSELTEKDKAIKNYLTVKGNCDFGTDFQDEIIQDIAGVKFLIAHGHHYSVKSSLINLLYRAEEKAAQVICFGHTHLPGAEMVQNKLFINPGSLRFPSVKTGQTYVILTITNGKIDYSLFDFDHGELIDFRQSFELL